MFLKEHRDSFECKYKQIGIVSLATFFILSLIFSPEDMFANKFLHQLSIRGFYHYVVCILTGISGSLTILCTCIAIDKRSKTMPTLTEWMKRIGSCTLGIYLWQKILLELLLPHFVKTDMPMVWYNTVFTPLVSLAFLLLCYYLTLLLRKNKTTRLLMLGEK